MVTPVVLTYNEDQNLEATLRSLAWARRIVVLDSGSTDGTEQLARSFQNVDFQVRRFDDHGSQWSYAIHSTSISTEYVLALDADMRPGPGFVEEMQEIVRDRRIAGGLIPFDYRVLGQGLRGSIYPAQIRLFKRTAVRVDQPGHTQVFEVAGGPLYRFRSSLIHEDHKPLRRWLNNQMNYAALEANRIRSAQTVTLKDRLRLTGLSPLLCGVYAYFRAGGPLNTRAAQAYACERIIFESLLARLLAEESGRPQR